TLVESRDGGATWNNLLRFPNFPFGLAGPVQSIAMASYQGPFTPDASFPQITDQGANTPDTKTFYFTDGLNIFMTKDDAITFQNRTNGTALAGLGSIQQIVVDPRNRDIVYAVRSTFNGGQVWQTTDAGRTWKNISNNLPNVPAWSIALDPRNGALYVGNDE